MFKYPIKTKKPKTLLGTTNMTGTFPVGRLHSWHGGIHIESSESIQAIADGTIIAYRMPEKYLEAEIDGKKSCYSNAFVLIQHHYKSKEGQKLTYYSLYSHLWPACDMATEFVSEIFQKATYLVENKSDIPAKYGVYIIADPKGKTKLLVPYDAMLLGEVMTDTEKKQWKNLKNYRKVKYITPTGEVHNNYFLDATQADVIIKEQAIGPLFKGKTYYRIKKADQYEEIANGAIGLRERSEAGKYGKKNNHNILRVIPYGTEVEIEPKPTTPKWHKVIYPDNLSAVKYSYLEDREHPEAGYICVDPQKIKYSCNKTVVQGNEVTCCAIPVSAGTILGKAGYYGFERQETYRSAHIEVFTAESEENIEKFLANGAKDDKKARNYLKIKKGTSLTNTFTYPLKKKLPVKVIETKGDYTQIEIIRIEKEVKYEYLGKHEKGKGYKLTGPTDDPDDKKKQADFNQVNAALGGFLTKQDRLQYIEKTTKKEVQEDSKKELTVNYRKVYYSHPLEGKRFWASTDMVNDAAPPKLKKLEPAIGNIKDSTCGKAEEVKEETSETQKKKHYLKADLKEVYFDDPNEFKETKLEEDAIILSAEVKEYVDDKKNKWIYIANKVEDLLNDQKIYNGALKIDGKQENIKKVSAYNWKEFGFNVINDPEDKIIYNCESQNGFLKDVWDEIDRKKKRDGKLSYPELRAAFQDESIVRHLSRQVCWHTNEWSITYDGLKDEVEALYDKGIDAEKDEARKDRLKVLKEERLQTLEAKVGNLTWWDKVKVDTTSIPQKTPEKDLVNIWGNKPLNCFGRGKCLYSPYTKNFLGDCYFLNPNEKEDWCSFGSSVRLAPRLKKTAKKPEVQEIPLVPFPTNNKKVFHFHPVAFVEQMKRVSECKIFIVRKWKYWSGKNSSSATISQFRISNSDIKGYIAEPYGKPTSESNKDKCIPSGIYNLKWHTSKKFPKNKYISKGLAYLNNGFPKVYNRTVPESRGILIHIGNVGKHSEGCLLPGCSKKVKKKDGKETIIGVSNSSPKFYELIDYIEEKGIANIELVITENYE
ncbi:hypothetical protein DMA11_01840 [Marinilabiliaceae bacterium JC017]|nr:hypothetical protein DMA11_01840 [Marinilabiliaceae bacterium JC017]